MSRFRPAFREALTILLCSAIFGFAYTFVQGKGFFGTPPPRSVTLELPTSSPAIVYLPEAKNMFESGKALFIDSRHEFDFKLGHIKGAVNLPLAEFDRHADLVSSLPKEKPLVVYCDGAECNSSVELAVKLRERGLRDVRVFFAGWAEWQNQKLPTEGTR